MKLNQQRMFTQFFIYPAGKSVFSTARKKEEGKKGTIKKKSSGVGANEGELAVDENCFG